MTARGAASRLGGPNPIRPEDDMSTTSLIQSSRSHLAEAGMDYFGHLLRATRIGGTLIAAGVACLVHGLLPGLFTTKASRTVVRLHEEISAHGPAESMWLEFEI
jgi:hypothetical protein